MGRREEVKDSSPVLLKQPDSGTGFGLIVRELLRIIAGEQSAARRPAARSVVVPREAQSVFRKSAKIRRCDFRAVAPKVRVAEKVHDS